MSPWWMACCDGVSVRYIDPVVGPGDRCTNTQLKCVSNEGTSLLSWSPMTIELSHLQATWHFIQQLVQADSKEYIKAMYYWPYVTGGYTHKVPYSKVHGANMGTTCVLSAQDGPHVGPMNLAIRGARSAKSISMSWCYHGHVWIILIPVPGDWCLRHNCSVLTTDTKSLFDWVIWHYMGKMK